MVDPTKVVGWLLDCVKGASTHCVATIDDALVVRIAQSVCRTAVQNPQCLRCHAKIAKKGCSKPSALAGAGGKN